MSEIMRPLPFKQLMKWIVKELNQKGHIFGIDQSKFYRNDQAAGLTIYGQKIATPIGPAPGPNSQLAPNIIAAYLCGSRFIELKTVQKIDGEELANCIPRPCIKAEDEGYNVEWSTELTTEAAAEEYIKAWLIIHVLAKELKLAEQPDCIFNLSVGYDLEGIKGTKVNTFIETLKDATKHQLFDEAKDWLKANIEAFNNLTIADIEAISPHISNNITLSTLHGCPPDEIEKISRYLMEEKQLNTAIKCNPTLLGYQFARQTMDNLGYQYLQFDDHHFKHDLQYSDAIPMFKRLLALADSLNLSFGLKISNTFPVKIKAGELPGEEMYMSGRALFPLSISLAAKISNDFMGKLPISYSGGIDAFNIKDVLGTGIKPITVATTILKPGGYQRLQQLAYLSTSLTIANQIDYQGLEQIAQQACRNKLYAKHLEQRKSAPKPHKLPLFDCGQAPCRESACPIEQQIPAYLEAVAAQNYQQAMQVIAIDNAAPAITAAICNHDCQKACLRRHYEYPMQIRGAKQWAVQKAMSNYIGNLPKTELKHAHKVAIIGAGPAGMGAAIYLRRNGLEVDVYDKKGQPFGIVQHIIPDFRINQSLIDLDTMLAEATGVNFYFNTEIKDIASLKADYNYIIIAIGAWGNCRDILAENNNKLMQPLDFLGKLKSGHQLDLGAKIAIIGGGNVAMDCARAAKKLANKPEVSIIYRRTIPLMPADSEEIIAAKKEDIIFEELLAPIAYDGQKLQCQKMRLGAMGADGRPKIEADEQTMEFSFDTVINATGMTVDYQLLTDNGLLDSSTNYPQTDENNCVAKQVYLIGDCLQGPSTIVSALADAKKVAKHILADCGLEHDFIKISYQASPELLSDKKGVLKQADSNFDDGHRCLGCDKVCQICVDVCPNRANIALELPGFARESQIIHIDQLCNECGNCAVFCPYDGRPYQDKFTIFATEDDLLNSTNFGFIKDKQITGHYLMRLRDESIEHLCLRDAKLTADYWAIIQEIEQNYPYLIG